jgi:glutaredoxin
MDALIVYSSKKNRQCEELLNALNEQGIRYREIIIEDPDAVTTIRNNGRLSLEPPVIQVVYGNRKMNFFKNDDLFWDRKRIRDALVDLTRGSDPV